MSDQKTTAMVYGNKPKTLKSYIIGLGLSLLFTFMSFALVGFHSLPSSYIYVIVAILAVAQLIAQVACFLRMSASPEGRWNLMPFIFTLVIVFIVVGGTLWIMFNLNYNMVH